MPGAAVKRFATELRGKAVVTDDGQIRGGLDDFLLDGITGRIESLLVQPAESVDRRHYKTDAGGRIILRFGSMRAMRDVILAELPA